MDYIRLGERVRRYREKKGMTQTALAEAAGLSERAIYNIEFARKRVQLESLLRIASALGVSPDALLSGTGNDSKESRTQELTRLLGNCSSQGRHLILEISEKLAQRLSQ